jgi:hypothetical protein
MGGIGPRTRRLQLDRRLPVGGWWKRNQRKDRLDLPVRYALLVSLKTHEQGIDLYTPIATQLRIPVATEIAGS